MITTTFSLGDEQSDLYKRFEHSLTVNGSDHAWHDFTWMTSQMRTELIQYAYSRINDQTMKVFVQPKEILYWLGDVPTIEEEIKAYRKADGARDIVGPPDVLPYLIDDLTHASSENHMGVPGKFSLMDTSVINAFVIIDQWPAFPSATHDWAQRTCVRFGVHGSGPNALENRLLREWWDHNKNAILARRYADAMWLPPQN
jgi:hypothetical protein